MPAIAIVGAAGSVMAGMAAVEAGSMIVGGLMIAGGVTSGLGTLTGDRTLSQLGGADTAWLAMTAHMVKAHHAARVVEGALIPAISHLQVRHKMRALSL